MAEEEGSKVVDVKSRRWGRESGGGGGGGRWGMSKGGGMKKVGVEQGWG